MAEPVLWLGGWASGLGCWRRELEALYPGRAHAFLDAHDVLARPSLLERAAAELPPGGVLAAWSLGSLLAHAAREEGRLPAGLRLVSLCPIFDFCGEGGAWPPAALARMIRRLPRAREAVLAEFWALVKGSSHVTQEGEAAWLAQSRGYSLDALVQGLEALASLRADPGAAAASPGIAFLASRRDPLAPAPRGAAGAAWVLYPKGHLPFLDHPATAETLLGGRMPGGPA